MDPQKLLRQRQYHREKTSTDWEWIPLTQRAAGKWVVTDSTRANKIIKGISKHKRNVWFHSSPKSFIANQRTKYSLWLLEMHHQEVGFQPQYGLYRWRNPSPKLVGERVQVFMREHQESHIRKVLCVGKYFLFVCYYFTERESETCTQDLGIKTDRAYWYLYFESLGCGRHLEWGKTNKYFI